MASWPHFQIFLSKKKQQQQSFGMERMEKPDWDHGKIFHIDPPRQCCFFCMEAAQVHLQCAIIRGSKHSCEKGVTMTHITILTHFSRSAVVCVVAVAPERPLGPSFSLSLQPAVEFIAGRLTQSLLSFFQLPSPVIWEVCPVDTTEELQPSSIPFFALLPGHGRHLVALHSPSAVLTNCHAGWGLVKEGQWWTLHGGGVWKAISSVRVCRPKERDLFLNPEDVNIFILCLKNKQKTQT